MQADQARLHALCQDHDKFMQYADLCIQERAAAGKETTPLQAFTRNLGQSTSAVQRCLRSATGQPQRIHGADGKARVQRLF